MELTELKNKIINSFGGSKSDLVDMLELIDKDEAIFPFNEYEHLICALINKGNMTYDQYLEIRAEYISENPNLWIFEISAPRGFGEKFAQTYIQGKASLPYTNAASLLWASERRVIVYNTAVSAN